MRQSGAGIIEEPSKIDCERSILHEQRNFLNSSSVLEIASCPGTVVAFGLGLPAV